MPRGRPEIPLDQRFWSKVEKADVGCWIWRATVDAHGYGVITVPIDGAYRTNQPNSRRRKCLKAHRVAWVLSRGPIPPGMAVCHKCDNPPCVRPDHLFTASQHINNLDTRRKHRHARGDRLPQTRLTVDAVREIRARAGNATQEILAREYGVSPTTIYHVLAGHTWKHVA